MAACAVQRPLRLRLRLPLPLHAQRPLQLQLQLHYFVANSHPPFALSTRAASVSKGPQVRRGLLRGQRLVSLFFNRRGINALSARTACQPAVGAADARCGRILDGKKRHRGIEQGGGAPHR